MEFFTKLNVHLYFCELIPIQQEKARCRIVNRMVIVSITTSHHSLTVTLIRRFIILRKYLLICKTNFKLNFSSKRKSFVSWKCCQIVSSFSISSYAKLTYQAKHNQSKLNIDGTKTPFNVTNICIVPGLVVCV